MRDLTRDRLQRFLDSKTKDGLSKSGSLVTPKEAKTFEKRSMTKEEIHLALSELDLRERLFLFAALVGMRPGEIFALRWGRVGPDMVNIMERVYRRLPSHPKSERGKRFAAVPPDLANDIEQWRDVAIDLSPESLVFPSERGTFMSRDNFLRRNIHSKLERAGLGWVNFHVLPRTQASLGHKEGVDPNSPCPIWRRKLLMHIGGAGAFACELVGMGLLTQAAKAADQRDTPSALRLTRIR